MGQGMNKVLPGLYLGSFKDSIDRKQIEKNRITHILSIHDSAEEGYFEHIIYHCVKVKDCEKTNLQIYFRECIEFIHDARLQGGNVLVHCKLGVSRSPTIAIAYIMTITDLSWIDAMNAVKGARKQIEPNDAFQRQLSEFEKEQLKCEKENLCSKFGECESFLDIELCKSLIDVNFAQEDKMMKQRLNIQAS